MSNKIWALFSIANEYDQPENNLEAWWYEKPTFNMIAKLFNITVDKKRGNSFIGKLLKGQEIREGWYNYRLREIEEGVRLSNVWLLQWQ